MSNKGIFEVDITALKLSNKQLDLIEGKINAVVSNAIALHGFKDPPVRHWDGIGTRGIRYLPDNFNEGIVDVRPYGNAMQEAVRSGDIDRMKHALNLAEDYISRVDEIKGAMKDLKSAIRKV